VVFSRKRSALQKNKMGATIHMHIEVQKDGQWLHYSAPSILRDRDFFDLVAGIYCNLDPIVTPRGLPADISPLTSYCYALDEESYRLHHQGWLSSKELLALQCRLNEIYPEKFSLEKDLEESYFHCYIDGGAIATHKGFDDARLIFWFDH